MQSPMDRKKTETLVASALGLATDHPDVQTIVRLSASHPGKHWSSWPWWVAAKPHVLADEGGFWGVVSIITTRACALVANGQDAESATLDAVHEVGREIRATYAVATDSVDITTLGIPAPSGMYSEAGPPAEVEARVALVLGIATESERALIDLLAKGYTQAEAAEELGITPNSANQRMYRIRTRAEKVTNGN